MTMEQITKQTTSITLSQEEYDNMAHVDGVLYLIDNGNGVEKVYNGNQVIVESQQTMNVTYSELKTLRDNGALIPGQSYRITDYECTTIEDNTISAGHVFDIIVTAIDESHLSEEAKAAHHEGDTYFANSNLDAWNLHYCIDNDRSRFDWASDGSLDVWIEYDDRGTIIRAYRTAIIEGEVTAWQFFNGRRYKYTAPNPSVGDTIFVDAELTREDRYTVSATGEVQRVDGKGVIYRMIDEFGNDCPYDFKNLKFARYEITAVENGHNDDTYPSHTLVGTWGLANGKVEVDDETSEYFYTFSSMQNGSVVDASLTIAAHHNTISSYIDGVQKLNNMVFINASGTLNCYGNRFVVNCYNNTFGNTVYNNTFDNNVHHNTFGNEVYNNTFGNDVRYNTFGNDVGNNTFGNDVYDNTFGNSMYRNTFGNDVGNNTFGNEVKLNTFGNNVYYNTFGNGMLHNNTFGNNVSSNTFGYNVNNNTFGNNVSSNTFGNHVQQLTVFDGVAYCDVTGGSNASSCVQNAQILNGTQGTNDQNMLTISFSPNQNNTQCAAKNSSGVLKIWYPADLVA